MNREDCQRESPQRLVPRYPQKAPNPKQAYGDLKVPLGLVPPSAIALIATAMSVGANKYGPFNWRDDPVELMTYIHAMERHLYAFRDREDIDPESGCWHLALLGAGNAIMMDAIVGNTAIDNRPTAGGVGALLRQLAKQP